MKKKRPKNGVAKALRTPRYKMQVTPDKKKAQKAEGFTDFCIYCFAPRGDHDKDCLLRGFQ